MLGCAWLRMLSYRYSEIRGLEHASYVCELSLQPNPEIRNGRMFRYLRSSVPASYVIMLVRAVNERRRARR